MSAIQKFDDESSVLAAEEVAVLVPNTAAALNKSEVEAQLDAAHKYRRSIDGFLKDAITLATLTKDVAASCIYALPRDGKNIAGPSIRLAEICASAYGNLHVGARVVGVEDREVIAQGVAWDLEKNLRVTTETRRRITNKYGKRYNDDMITVTGNAAASIGLRNAIFRVIPRAYVQMVYDRARAVAVGDASTLTERRQAVLDRLVKMGALLDRILLRIGRRAVEDVTLGDLEILIGIGTSIKNGDVLADEAFPAVSTTPERSTVDLDSLRAAPEREESQKPQEAHGDGRYINPDQQNTLMNLFRDFLEPGLRKKAEDLLFAYLKDQEIVNEEGKGDLRMVLADSFVDVKEAALAHAKELRELKRSAVEREP